MVNQDNKTPGLPELYELANAMLLNCYDGQDSKEIIRSFLIGTSKIRTDSIGVSLNTKLMYFNT